MTSFLSLVSHLKLILLQSLPTFTFSELTIETLEQGVKYIQS